jgi:hypothetical protein
MKKWLLVSLGLAALVASGPFFLANLIPHSKSRYAWLIFGPKRRVEVRVCLDAGSLVLDHFVDGKPAARLERIQDRAWTNVTIADPDGETSYVITGMTGSVVRHGVPTMLTVGVNVQGQLEYRQYGEMLDLSEDPEKASRAHFHGPLKVEAQTIQWRLPGGLALRRGDEPTGLLVWVGTLGAEKGCRVVVCSNEGKNSPWSDGVYPFAEVDFPGKQPGDPPIKKRFALDQLC